MKSQVVERFEREFLEAVLRAHDGNITQAARAAKKNRRAFWELLRKHDLLRGSSRTQEYRAEVNFSPCLLWLSSVSKRG